MDGLKGFQWRFLAQVNAVSAEQGALQEALCTPTLWNSIYKGRHWLGVVGAGVFQIPQENGEKEEKTQEKWRLEM